MSGPPYPSNPGLVRRLVANPDFPEPRSQPTAYDDVFYPGVSLPSVLPCSRPSPAITYMPNAEGTLIPFPPDTLRRLDGLGATVEDTGKNQAGNTADLTAGFWTPTNCTVVASPVLGPDLVGNLQTITSTIPGGPSGGARCSPAAGQIPLVTPGGVYSVSFYMKQGSSPYGGTFAWNNGGRTHAGVTFDLAAGAIHETAGADLLRQYIAPGSPGEWRCSLMFTAQDNIIDFGIGPSSGSGFGFGVLPNGATGAAVSGGFAQYEGPTYAPILWAGTPGNGNAPTGWANTGGDNLALTLVASAALPFPYASLTSAVMQIRRTTTGYQGIQTTGLPVSINRNYNTSIMVRVPTGVTATQLLLWTSGDNIEVASAATLNAQPKDQWVAYYVYWTASADSTFSAFVSSSGSNGQGFDLVLPSQIIRYTGDSPGPSTYIPGTSAGAVRHADDLTGLAQLLALASGDVGTVLVEATLPYIDQETNQSAGLLGLYPNRELLTAGYGEANVRNWNSSVELLVGGGGDWRTGARAAIAWDTTPSRSITMTGSAGASDGNGVGTAATTCHVGGSPGSSNYANGLLHRISALAVKKTLAELNSLVDPAHVLGPTDGIILDINLDTGVAAYYGAAGPTLVPTFSADGVLFLTVDGSFWNLREIGGIFSLWRNGLLVDDGGAVTINNLGGGRYAFDYLGTQVATASGIFTTTSVAGVDGLEVTAMVGDLAGPAIPTRLVPGSNAIGGFVIGVSPIGTISWFDVWTTVISQYANSDILTALIVDFAQCVDMTKSFDDFFDLMWNVDTAQGYGLDVIGRKVGVSRTVAVPTAPTYFGFNEAGGLTFGEGTFYAGTPFSSNFRLSDAAFRVLIFAKALANISDGSILSINQILLNLFPSRGKCYVTDGENMTMTYTFEFVLSPVELSIVSTSGVLPKPAGVLATVVSPSA